MAVSLDETDKPAENVPAKRRFVTHGNYLHRELSIK